MAGPHTPHLNCTEEADVDPAQAQQDNHIILLIHGLTLLIDKANRLGMGTAAKILHFAKEELVHWAVEMNFHETAADRFVNFHLYNLSILRELIAHIRESTDQNTEPQQEPAPAAMLAG